jgi:hypothetical protein
MNWQRKGIRRNSSVDSVTALDLKRIGFKGARIFSSVSDQDSIRSLDPDPESGSRSRRAKMTN